MLYPNWVEALKPGDPAYFADPQDDKNTGVYRVVEIRDPEDIGRAAESFVRIVNPRGKEFETTITEISPIPDNLFQFFGLDEKGVLHHLGYHRHPVEAAASHGLTNVAVGYVIDENRLEQWKDAIQYTPTLGAYFGLVRETGSLRYLGHYEKNTTFLNLLIDKQLRTEDGLTAEDFHQFFDAEQAHAFLQIDE